eukprot:Rhum_TRINITY_DN15062_c4_g4::Rhum_TRINITY_DN15062_c4_g4_i4::g.135567::m.135567
MRLPETEADDVALVAMGWLTGTTIFCMDEAPLSGRIRGGGARLVALARSGSQVDLVTAPRRALPRWLALAGPGAAAAGTLCDVLGSVAWSVPWDRRDVVCLLCHARVPGGKNRFFCRAGCMCHVCGAALQAAGWDRDGTVLGKIGAHNRGRLVWERSGWALPETKGMEVPLCLECDGALAVQAVRFVCGEGFVLCGGCYLSLLDVNDVSGFSVMSAVERVAALRVAAGLDAPSPLSDPSSAARGLFTTTTAQAARDRSASMVARVRGVVLEKERKGRIAAGKSLSLRLQAKRMGAVRAAGGGAAAAGATGGGGGGDGARAAAGMGRGRGVWAGAGPFFFWFVYLFFLFIFFVHRTVRATLSPLCLFLAFSNRRYCGKARYTCPTAVPACGH